MNNCNKCGNLLIDMKVSEMIIPYYYCANCRKVLKIKTLFSFLGFELNKVRRL